MKFLLGKKEGMTSVIEESGVVVPVTVIAAGPCFVTQVKSGEKDGYTAVQVGFSETKKTNKPKSGHLKDSGKVLRHLKEYRTKEIEEVKVGDMIDVSIFEKGDKVKISGTIKGRGFTGPVKKYGFRGHPAGHGHPQQRRVGSIGSRYPQRVIKGLRMAGHYGDTRKTISNLQVVGTDKENNLLLVKGSLPGSKGSLLEIKGN